MDIIDGGGDMPFCDGNNTIGFHRDTVRREDEVKERDRDSIEIAFLDLASQSKITKH